MFRPPDFYGLGSNMHEPSKMEQLDPLLNQLCRVCDEPAAGFHFGAFTCEGCKSFFGRTCNNQSVIQDCKNNYRCVVDKKNRTSCKACRLRKCLMVGMSKSGSRYGRRSNWFKIHCLMQSNGSKRQPPQSPPVIPAPHKFPLHENQIPPTLSWPPRIQLPIMPPMHKTSSAFESYGLLKPVGRQETQHDLEEHDVISVSRSPSPLNISSVSDTSSKSSQSIIEENRNTLLEPNKNHVQDTVNFPNALFPFGAQPHLSPLYNPLSFASPLYRLSPLLAANSLFGNPLLMFGHKSHLEILEEHKKLIERFTIASASKSNDSFDEKPVKVEDPIDLTFKTSDDDKCEDDD